ncbi:Uncharacterized conserved protein YybS, DUF2232 family [Lachnospiraceae bacterium]|nr:Uncharacterized conserved protein YybS, DUF2232 family [Lachnospiraceae bacterium]
MNVKTQKITFGAMIVAIFAIMLLLNRQTGDMLQSIFFFVYPIPMVAFSAKYGLRDSLAVFICTLICTIFFGTVLTAFYAVTQALVGIVYGTCLYHKKDPAKTILLVMVLCAVFSLASLWVDAAISGIQISQTATELKNIFESSLNKAMEQTVASGNYDEASLAQMKEGMAKILSMDFLTRIVFISMALTGVFQGIVIYILSTAILVRLRFPIQKAKPITSFYPPEWSGILALALNYFMQYAFAKPFSNTLLQSTIETLGFCSSIYLWTFGVMAAAMFLHRKAHWNKMMAILLPSVLLLTILQGVALILGCAYISLGLHRWLETEPQVQY